MQLKLKIQSLEKVQRQLQKLAGPELNWRVSVNPAPCRRALVELPPRCKAGLLTVPENKKALLLMVQPQRQKIQKHPCAFGSVYVHEKFRNAVVTRYQCGLHGHVIHI